MHKLLKELNDAEAVSEIIDSLWDKDPESEELEKAYDKARKQEKAARMKLAEEITKASGIRLSQSLTLIELRRDKIESILNEL